MGDGASLFRDQEKAASKEPIVEQIAIADECYLNSIRSQAGEEVFNKILQGVIILRVVDIRRESATQEDYAKLFQERMEHPSKEDIDEAASVLRELVNQQYSQALQMIQEL